MSTLLLPALAAAALTASPAEVAMLCSPADGASTQLRFQRVGDTALAEVAAELAHLPGETVLGAVLPGTRSVLAIAATMPSRDLSFASSLVRLDAGKPPRFLVDKVVSSSRPFLTANGRIFVQRGTAGADPTTRGAMRVDALTIDEVSLRDGKPRTVLAFSGFFLFIAGEFDGRLLIYRAGVEGADIVAVHPDALSVQVLARITPLARDFVVDVKNRALYYTQGDPARGQWFLERLDLVTHKTSPLAAPRSFDMALLPTLFPQGTLAYSPKIGEGLRLVGGDRTVLAGQGNAGYERIRFFTRQGVLAIGLHEVPSDFPSPFAVDVRTGQALPLLAPPKARLDIAGVIER